MKLNRFKIYSKIQNMEIAHILLIVTSSQVPQLELGRQKFKMIQFMKSTRDTKVNVDRYLRKMKKHH